VQDLWSAHTHDWLLCFSTRGRLYWLRVFELPAGSSGSRGKPFVNLLPLQEGERITAVLPVKTFEKQYVFMATRRGTVKKTPLAEFSRPRAAGIIAVDLRVDDALVDVALTSGENDILLFSDAGRVIRFNEKDVRSMGRLATGVRGMRLVKAGAAEEEESAAAAAEGEGEAEAEPANGNGNGAHVIALIVARQGDVLTVSSQGYGKRTPIDGFPLRGRGGQGVIAQALSDKTGELIGAVEVDDSHDIMLISDGGRLIRVAAKEIKTLGRNTQGVRVVRPGESDRLVSLDRMLTENGGDEAAAGGGEVPGETPPEAAPPASE
jgi:DNA gyrase subunit A